MLLWLLALPLPALASLDKTLGVAPALLAKYSPPKSGAWKCLDGSKEIPWDFVNDDACDCPDGSDEPGTSACPNSTFYCQNAGHIGATIPSSRVNDGLCEPECCDGSDERPGVCKNACKEIGEEYRKKRDAERKIQKTGAKIRSSYIAFAHKEKKRLEALVESTTAEIAVREIEVARLRDIADRTESLSAAALEHKQQSPLYISLTTHASALKALQREHKKHLEREQQLGDILDALRKGYNPNYQDMAVLEAVRGWEFLAGLPHIGVEEDAQAAEAGEVAKKEEEAVEEKKEDEEDDDEEWTAEDLSTGLDDLLNTDYVSLLLAHDDHVQTPPPSSLFNVRSYLPDSLIPQYEGLRETLLSWLEVVGIAGSDAEKSTDSSKARQAFNDAEAALNRVKKDKKTAEEDLDEIFNVQGFGAEGEWKKLDGSCLALDTGEYTYEVCMFEEAKQKPNKGGTTFNLGKFSSWNPSPDVKPGDPAYYEKQIYNGGTQCWNGPQRSVALVLKCGTENAIHTVAELEKCEYQFTGTSPALCLPLDANGNGNGREEL
ncbi:glucosidase II beta subunit-like-domain-containing protein [Mycena albidolilacea]|uniref:Glucosidase 2 subunit beta n=1 Tax=Mycena albidolilacea TaxID=1033008 RepID=A0AAD7ATM6_9AGAR|nr:glucosidase II beta subunit-like-domain-containing protein [Mycena albidolilacea]